GCVEAKKSCRMRASLLSSPAGGVCSLVICSSSLARAGDMSMPVRLVPVDVRVAMIHLLTWAAGGCVSVAEFGAGAPDVFGGDGVAGGAVPVDVMPIFPSGGRLLAAQAARDEVGAVDGELDLLVQDLAHELAVALVADRLRQL